MGRWLWFAALLVGCGNGEAPMDGAVVMDLSVGDLVPADAGFLAHCVPTSINQTVLIDATLSDVAGDPIAGVTVSVYKADETFLANASYGDAGTATNLGGEFSLSVPIGGQPLYGYLLLAGSTIPTTRFYFTFTTDIHNGGITVPTRAQLTMGYQSGGVTQETGKGTVVAQFQDCAGMGLKGATGQLTPAAGAVRYDDGAQVVASATATQTSKDGFIFGLNAPAGATTLTVLRGAQSVVTSSFKVPADGIAYLFAVRP